MVRVLSVNGIHNSFPPRFFCCVTVNPPSEY
jgi:hypothetical protein